MAIPARIPIRHEPNHRTDTISRYDDGLFFGWISGGYSPNYTLDADWAAHMRWYAILHRFDHDGRHTSSDIWCPGDGIRDGQRARLDGWLAALPGRAYCDIAIRPFQIEADGIVFGLVLESHHEHPDGHRELDWAEFYPGRLGFSSPWDGCYDT